MAVIQYVVHYRNLNLLYNTKEDMKKEVFLRTRQGLEVKTVNTVKIIITIIIFFKCIRFICVCVYCTYLHMLLYSYITPLQGIVYFHIVLFFI